MEFFLLRLVLHIAIFPAQIVLHPDGKRRFRVGFDINGQQRFAHIVIDARNLLAAGFRRILNRFQSHFAIVVVVKIFIKQLLIA